MQQYAQQTALTTKGIQSLDQSLSNSEFGLLEYSKVRVASYISKFPDDLLLDARKCEWQFVLGCTRTGKPSQVAKNLTNSSLITA